MDFKMLNSNNMHIVTGNLTDDVELRQTPGGKSVATFTVACNRHGENAGTDFLRIVAWEREAERVSKEATKGSCVLIVGSVRTRTYTDGGGAKRYITETVADHITVYGAPKLATPTSPFEDVAADESLPF